MKPSFLIHFFGLTTFLSVCQEAIHASDNGGLLVYSTWVNETSEIHGLYLNDDKNDTIIIDIDGEPTFVSLVNGHIYWRSKDRILKATVNTSQLKLKATVNTSQLKLMIIDSGIKFATSFAVDFISTNIYFTNNEKSNSYIGICSSDGYVCTVLRNEHIVQPGRICLSSNEGLMFWINNGSQPSIFRSGMDGSNPTALVTQDIVAPHALAIDASSRKVYWTDLKLARIETIRFDKKYRTMIYSLGEVSSIQSMFIFGNQLFWNNYNQLKSCNKVTGKDEAVVKNVFNKTGPNWLGPEIFIYDYSSQQPVENPCENSPCSGLCFLAPASATGLLHYKCACPLNKKLTSNGRECVDITTPIILFAAFENTDMLFNIDFKPVGRQKIDGITLNGVHISALAYNARRNTILISADNVSNKIYSYDLHEAKWTPLEMVGLGPVSRLHYDEFGNNLYWMDRNSSTIEATSLATFSTTTVVAGNSTKYPIDFVLVSNNLFVLFHIKIEGRSRLNLERLSMDGTVTVSTQFVGMVTDEFVPRLYADDDAKLLYVANRTCIKSFKISGENAATYNLISGPRGTLTSVAVMADMVFWTDGDSQSIFWAPFHDVASVSEIELVGNTFDDNQKIQLLQRKKMTNISSPCHENNGGCSRLCFASHQNHSQIVCAAGPDTVTVEPVVPNSTTCSRNEYQCSSKECIPLHQVCDTNQDCLLGDDELLSACHGRRCASEQFSCLDQKTCVKREKACDGHFDCDDRSDEICPFNGTSEKFRCDSEEYIDIQFRCDGRVDCKGARDELNCLLDICGKDHFRCKSGQCIPKEWKCDGDRDCADGSDETDECVATQCKPSEFQCINRNCVDKTLKCNNHDDCHDGSDELDCFDIPQGYSHFERCKKFTESFYNLSKEGRCLPISRRCNDTRESVDGIDKSNCNMNLGLDCIRHNRFYCDKLLLCIPREKLYEHANACGYNANEYRNDIRSRGKNTTTKYITSNNCQGFECDNGECIALSSLCNHVIDCTDMSDEGAKCSVPCQKHKCDQKCIQTPRGPQCHCKKGYKLEKNNKTCVDINECDSRICTQDCVNLHGSFKCSCYSSNYMLQSDGVFCKARGDPLQYVTASDSHLNIILKKEQRNYTIGFNPQYGKIRNIAADEQRSYLYILSDRDELHNMSLVNGTTASRIHLPQVTSFAHDWITNNIYYVKENSSIMVTDFTSSKKYAILYHAYVGSYIGSLSVDPEEGYLFWFESSDSTNFNVGEIKGMDCNGKFVRTILSSLKYGVIEIVVDSFARRIYWMERTGSRTIYRTDYHGLNTEIMLEGAHTYCNTTAQSVYDCSSVNSELNNSIHQLDIMQAHRQRTVRNVCASKSCADFCTITPTGPVCVSKATESNGNGRFYLMYFGGAVIVVLLFSAIAYCRCVRTTSNMDYKISFHKGNYAVSKNSCSDLKNEDGRILTDINSRGSIYSDR